MIQKSKEFNSLTFGPDEVIVLTGGSGFLGQHIIRIIQERCIGIKEIRVVDVRPYKKQLDFVEKFPIVSYRGDVSIEDQLDKPFDGATMVIHSAAIVSIGHHVDRNQMRSVNVIGTSNVVFKCRQWNISNLVITSSVDAVFKKDSIFEFQTESETELPSQESNLLMGYYGFTKAQSEAQVICSRNLTLTNGGRLRTAILRPTVLYGECDTLFIPVTMRIAKSCGGYLVKPYMFTDEPILQTTYAGNAAWAHLLAAHKLKQEGLTQSNKQEIDGETFFVTDDTNPKSIYDFMKVFLELKGYGVIGLPIPLFLLLWCVWGSSWFIQNIFPISWKKFLNEYPFFPTYESFRMAHSQVTCSRKKIRDWLDYKPIYTEQEAQSNSSNYYKDI